MLALARRCKPDPSPPSTTADGRVQSTPYSWLKPRRQFRQSRRYALSVGRIKRGRLVARAIGKCSTAPAEALATVSFNPAARRSGMKTPSAPAHSAVRRIAPRLPWILDSIEHHHQRFACAAHRARRSYPAACPHPHTHWERCAQSLPDGGCCQPRDRVSREARASPEPAGPGANSIEFTQASIARPFSI